MNTHRKNAIIVGVLFITATIAGILSLPFSGLVDDPDYLMKVTEHENQVIIGALFVFIMSFACAGIAIWLYPVLKTYHEALALGSVGFRMIEATFHIVAAIGLLSILSLSQEYVQAGAPDASHFQTSGMLILAVCDWSSQVVAILAWCLGALMYYYIFYRSKLIPRWLSTWGFIGVALCLSVTSFSMFGIIDPFSTIGVMLNLPIGLQEMVLAVWLIVKGFNPSAIASGSAKQITTR